MTKLSWSVSEKEKNIEWLLTQIRLMTLRLPGKQQSVDLSNTAATATTAAATTMSATAGTTAD